jgi:thioredoxin-like negative regulator of GroEL
MAGLDKAGCNVFKGEDDRAYDHIPTLKTVQDFEEKVEDADRPVLVDSYRRLTIFSELPPIIGSLAMEYGNRVDFYRIDPDRTDELARRLNIQSTSAVIIYVDGQQTQRINIASIPKRKSTRQVFADALKDAIDPKRHCGKPSR